MAFKNYLIKDSYSVITYISYEKTSKRCNILLEIFTDETKKTVLAYKNLTVEGNYTHSSIHSITKKQKTPPPNDDSNMYYLIDDAAENEFAGYEGQLTKYNQQSKNWDKWILSDGPAFYVEDEQKYYIFSNQKWNELKNYTLDSRIWDKWLAPEVAMAGNTNLTKQMYSLLKTFPEFKDCEDV